MHGCKFPDLVFKGVRYVVFNTMVLLIYIILAIVNDNV